MSRADPATFGAAAADAFSFLTHAGFGIPVIDGYRAIYSSGTIAVEVAYDERDGRVVTTLDSLIGSRNPHASLRCLYVEAGLGPAQRVRDIARTSHSLSLALAAQAAALRELLPLLEAQAESLLIRCNGR